MIYIPSTIVMSSYVYNNMCIVWSQLIAFGYGQLQTIQSVFVGNQFADDQVRR